MSFDITILGSSGGPLEGITCSYILKPSYISYKSIIEDNLSQYLIAIDAGSGLNRITEIITNEKSNSKESIANKILSYYEDSLSIQHYIHHSISINHHYNICTEINSSPIELSFKILNLINTYLISHPHLDHINGLIINSAAFHNQSNKSKLVYGLKETTEALQKYIFNDIIWPNLIHESNGISFLDLIDIIPNESIQLNEIYKVIPFEINHGTKQYTNLEYKSTSFLIKDLNKNQYILIFGDVESDKNSKFPKNKFIWESISDLITTGRLKSIIIECSTPNLPDQEPRFGHLTPDSLIDELKILQNIILNKSDTSPTPPLNGLNILITHVKENKFGKEPRKIILNELNELNEKYNLGCQFSILLTGLTYTV
ncbi:3',5'-cyclic-nucleotide phosphodiesterase 1 [Wickerhamomyces ciferrii]|uniref:3',5'-cyclic-nucleotide phosphodiesterase 1 n=1 Tax=Wickerhamomyces ciferrii (strain ATCC 14091 / BCRC 22168 / CBS 111 / JCM 3599 / NBRC 0793 / NRRL Y-1031 F-60-10) TaxID=1206466 RepID=K0KQQ6_WICCF|nr:3',5'-cyclic-nucleotide phosphodiesterase 1 [Wickerhamomyces ciferrii]CCH43598.1 3',5'-cyclic-nucleotide phosphodiesterase 1 [Wickerhamomyces ciferrii]